MKIKRTEIVERNLAYIICDLGVRYWEDTEVNGKEDDAENPTVPCVYGNDEGEKRWQLRIDANTGQIENWTKGVTAHVHYKICDDGGYIFVDSNKELIAEVRNYVPDFLCPAGGGYGDYAIFDVDAEGFIQGWRIDEDMVNECIDNAF